MFFGRCNTQECKPGEVLEGHYYAFSKKIYSQNRAFTFAPPPYSFSPNSNHHYPEAFMG